MPTNHFIKPQSAAGPATADGSRRRSERRDPRSEDGQALVEFALVLPVVLILLLGIAYFGIALTDWTDETNIANSGARYASRNEGCIVAESPKKCETREEAAFLKWLTQQGDNSQVKGATAEICSPTSEVGDWVEVKLTFEYNWLPLFEIAGAESPVTSTARMMIAEKPSTPYPTTCK